MLRRGQGEPRAPHPGVRARARALHRLPVAAAAGGALDSAARRRQHASVAASPPSRPLPVRVGDPRGRRRDLADRPPHGRAVRHRARSSRRARGRCPPTPRWTASARRSARSPRRSSRLRSAASSRAIAATRRPTRARRTRSRSARTTRRSTPPARAPSSSGRCGPGRGCSGRLVVGPVAEVGGRRVRVRAATLDDPGDADVPRLDASDGPLWLTSVEPL